MADTVKEIKNLPQFSRAATIEQVGRMEGEEDDRTVRLAFSSEEPVKRWFGDEILDHSPDSVRLGWFQKGTAPLLMDHSSRDHVGVVEQVELGNDRVGRATVRFGKSARANEILQDVRDGVRRNISVGYKIHHAVRVEMSDEEDTYRVDDWEPMEISIVSVPADQSVGVGRDDAETHPAIFEKRTEKMTDTVTDNTPAEVKDNPPTIDPAKAVAEARTNEIARIREIDALAARHNMKDAGEKAKEDETSIEAFRGIVLDAIGESKPLDTGAGDLDLSPRDARDYSLVRAIHAQASGNWRNAELERECSVEIAERMDKPPQGFYVPTDIQRQRMDLAGDVRQALAVLSGKRDLSVGTATAGGHLVGTDHQAASFIELLRNAMIVRRMGAQMLSGLRGNVQIPKQTGGAAATWILAEDGDATESEASFGVVSLTPKTVAAFTEMTRQLLLQSDPSVEQLVRADLAMSIALAIDAATINGSGASGQPTGILNTTGIGDVAGGTNGAAPTWAHVVNVWKEVAADNADFGSTGWMVNTNTVAKLAQTEKASGTAKFIIDDLPGPDGMVSIAGQRGGVSNQVPSNLSKGTGTGLSAMIYGNWRDVLIGEWGALDILADPYSNSSKGRVKVTVFQSVDVAVRHAQSFSAMQDAITT